MDIRIERVERLRFGNGAPVRAASGVAPLGDGFLVVQDDATHAAWVVGSAVSAVRLLPAVEGLEVFDEASGTKHLKPDLEAACPVAADGRAGVLVLGSGSSGARMRWVLLHLDDGEPRSVVADMTPLYGVVADALSVAPDALNMEGACVVGRSLRWFQRGLPSAGLPSGSVDLDLEGALAACVGRARPESVPLANPRHHEIGDVHGVGLAVTDAVALPDGAILASTAAEDSPNPRDDGPVVGSALVRLESSQVRDLAPLPLVEGRVAKVEGLMVTESEPRRARLLAVVDGDQAEQPSLALHLRVRW